MVALGVEPVGKTLGQTLQPVWVFLQLGMPEDNQREQEPELVVVAGALQLLGVQLQLILVGLGELVQHLP